MTNDETTVLLGFIQGVDRRIVLDERSIAAWMNVLPQEMDLETAMRCVREHYLESDKCVLPAHIVGRYRANMPRNEVRIVEPNHDCHKGFIYVTEVDSFGREYEAVTKCPLCQRKSDTMRGR